MAESARKVALSEKLQIRIRELGAVYPRPEAALLPILHAVQEEVGYFDPPAIAAVSRACGISEERISGVVSFYTLFRRRPAGRYHLLVCRTLCCALAGSAPLLAVLRDRYGLRDGEVSADGLFSLEEAECLAACSEGPALQINGVRHTRVTPQRLVEIMEGLRKEAAG